MAEIHLICNAHLDPVWQWEWEEGAAAAVSTFRAAADFCEEFDDFVFCHNEAQLYRWVEEYEPALFERIRKLVKAGKWHIAGGWYLQPDCNMPGAESIVRQMQMGRTYFKEKFGVVNTTAISFDAFGHNRGLVQLLKKAGYDSYLFMRPDEGRMTLPSDDFMWVGYDGSEIMAHRLGMGYNSPLGEAADKVRAWLEKNPDAELGLIPWGVGNHGGGPSRKDIADINALKAEMPERGVRHSLPEAFFKTLNAQKDTLPRVDTSLLQFSVGCYTSQSRVKQEHRRLEGLLNETERMLSHAAMAGVVRYPAEDLAEAARDLCFGEFHDILPGSSIQAVEDTSLQNFHHGAEIATRLRARAFYALAAAEKKAEAGEIPVLAYNPFPYELETDIACEFMLPDQNWKIEFTDVEVRRDGEILPSQIEKERSNLPLDWRKRVVFHAKLKPMQMNRFGCFLKTLPEKPKPVCNETDDAFVFDNGSMTVEISKKTGFMTRYCADGTDYLNGEAMKLLIVRDNADPWGMTVDRFRDVIGEFRLMDETESARFAGVKCETLPAVRVVESGDVRTVIEANFSYGRSCALVTWRLPKSGKRVEIQVRLLFMEKDRMVKLSVPTAMTEGYIGQGMFGIETLADDGRECVAQQWTAAQGGGKLLTLINDGVYGSDYADGEIRMSLLRSAGYTAHPINDREILPQDRFSPRIDQGERLYNFVMEGGEEQARLENVTREAQAFNEPPYALSFFPNGDGSTFAPAAMLKGSGVQMSALRPAQDGDGMIVRLFECEGRKKTVKLAMPLLNAEKNVALNPFEALTLRVRPTGDAEEANLLD